MKLAAYVGGLGLIGPGLNDWPHAAGILSGRHVYAIAATVLPAPALLPPAERRRTGRVVKLAVAVALEATAQAEADPAQLASVFCSSGADGHNCHEICLALAQPTREMSPTRFTNSVHNAAAGYWSIAAGATAASNAVSAYDASFAAGLLEALCQVTVDGRSVLVVAYDAEYPEPMRSVRPIPDAFGAALVLTPRRGVRSLARIEACLGDAPAETLADAPLERLRGAIPAARALPLMRRLALAEAGTSVLDYLGDSTLTVQVDPCL